MRPQNLLHVVPATARWYRDRARRLRSGRLVGWTAAEMICMTLSLGALLLLAASLLGRSRGLEAPSWVSAWALPLMIAGAVGYLTNLVAVTMLFRPYGPGDRHPVGAIWFRGLVPRNKDELARTAGQQVAERLLTPEAISGEVQSFIAEAFDDEALRADLRRVLGPIVRRQLPQIVDSLTPEVMGFLREVVTRGFTRENLERLLDEVVDPWLRDGRNQERLVDATVGLLRQQAPRLVSLLQELSDQYAQKGSLKRFAIWAAETTKALDWAEVRETIDELVDSRQTREQVVEFVQRELARFRKGASAEVEEGGELVGEIRDRAADFVAGIVEQHLHGTLPELGHRVADNPAFWRWLAESGLPATRPYLVSWLEREGQHVIAERFDIAGRVERAILDMRVQEMHEMIDEVSARHLGAIQVLGYALGLVLGGGLLLA